MLLSACHHIKKTQLVLFESFSFGMPVKSFEKVFREASQVVEEEEMAYRDTWRAEDPYFYKTGRFFYDYENISLKGHTSPGRLARAAQALSGLSACPESLPGT